MKIPSRPHERGVALLVVMGISSVLLLMVGFLFIFGGSERYRAIQQSRDPGRISCAGAGLQLAKGYFTNNFLNWNTYLADPHNYNPIKASWMVNGYTVTTPSGASTCAANCGIPANPVAPANTAGACSDIPLCVTHPELFFDLDGDGKPDVYIYIRDNADERPPMTAQNWIRDDDQYAIIGAVCISRTLAPRTEDRNISLDRLSIESMLNCLGGICGGISSGYDMNTHTATGTGNIN